MCHICDEDKVRSLVELEKARMVSPFKLDFPTVTTLVRAAIAIRGEDYVYPSAERGGCDYVHKEKVVDGDDVVEKLTPGCIVGMVFYMAGVPLESFKEIGGTLAGTEDQFNAIGVAMTEKAMHFLRAAQVKQDNGVPWGEAREEALLYVAGREYHFVTEKFIATRKGSEDDD